ncbi:MAG: sugar kinase, partial [Pseudorhodobacter sp.]|nr:sugar kinase [Rhizobacter sp.]
DISGVSQVLTQVTIGACYGDAFLAGRAAGLLSAADLHRWVRPERIISANPENKAIYDALFEQYLKLYTGTRDVMHALKSITKFS